MAHVNVYKTSDNNEDSIQGGCKVDIKDIPRNRAVITQIQGNNA